MLLLLRRSPLSCPMCHFRTVLALLSLGVPLYAFAQTPVQSFKDISPESSYYQAAEYLKSAGIVGGYSDGTFKPDTKVERGAALKMVLGAIMKPEQLAGITTTSFTDIPASTWYLPYAETARRLGIVDGPPKASGFNGMKSVRNAEFLKMYLKAQGVNVQTAFSDITLPLSVDAADSSAWFFPSLRFAITSSMVMAGKDGTFDLSKELTRGDVALLMFRYAMYKQGRRTQALLSEEESEIVALMQHLEKKDLKAAEFASARAILAARGAIVSKPSVPLVQGAMKTAEGFRALVEGYKAGTEGRLADAIQLSSKAWALAAKAKQFSASLDAVTTQMQTIAKNIADQARALEKLPTVKAQ